MTDVYVNKRLVSKRGKSGFKYVYAQNKQGVWKICSPSLRKNGFTSATSAADFLSKQLNPSWWEKSNVKMKKKELSRMDLFGIRLRMKIRKRYATGTVVGYLPCSQEHVVKFDVEPTLHNAHNVNVRTKPPQSTVKQTVKDRQQKQQKQQQNQQQDQEQQQPMLPTHKNEYHHFRLLEQHNWQRIPWDGNVLNEDAPCGEEPESTDDSMNLGLFGPECSNCSAFLGVGAEAWTGPCKICHIPEPGSCLWFKTGS